MLIDIKPQDAQLIQNAINSQLAGLNQKRRDLGQEYHLYKRMSADRYESGRVKLVEKIQTLQAIIGDLEPAKRGEFIEPQDARENQVYDEGFEDGYVAAETDYGIISDDGGQEEAIPAQQEVHEDFELLLIVWEGEGGLCR